MTRLSLQAALGAREPDIGSSVRETAGAWPLEQVGPRIVEDPVAFGTTGEREGIPPEAPENGRMR